MRWRIHWRERRRVPVPQQVIDQPGIVGDFFGAAPVRNPGRLNNGRIVAHIIDHPDKAVIENRHRLVQYLFEGGDGGAPCLAGLVPGGGDLGFLVVGQLHL